MSKTPDPAASRIMRSETATMRISKLTSGERLQRKGQAQAPVSKRETFVGSVIVIGASAGGHRAMEEILKDLSADIPAAIVVLIHIPVGGKYSLENFLERRTRIPIVPVRRFERLQQRTIFVLPPGKSATFL